MRTGRDVKVIKQDTVLLMAQWVKNLPAVCETQEMQVWSWVGKIPRRRKGELQCSCWRPHGQRSLAAYSPKGRRVGHAWARRQGVHTDKVNKELKAQIEMRGSVSMLASTSFKVQSTSSAPNWSTFLKRLRFLNRLHHLKQSQTFFFLLVGG